MAPKNQQPENDDEISSFDDLLNDAGDEGAKKAQDEAAAKAAAAAGRKGPTIKVGDKEIPIAEVGNVISTLQKKLEEGDTRFKDFQDKLLATLQGKQQDDGSLQWDEVAFFSDPEYRKKYLGELVDRRVEERIKGIEASQKNNDIAAGQRIYREITDEISQDLLDEGLEFDFQAAAPEIEKIVLATFSKEYLNANPKAALRFAVDQIMSTNKGRKPPTAAAQGRQMGGVETPTPGGFAGRIQSGTAQDIRDRIMGATPEGQSAEAGKSLF